MGEPAQLRRKRIAIIPGDGIGKEVIPEAVKVLKAAAAAGGRASCAYRVRLGR